MPVSGDTLLRLVRQIPLPPKEVPRIVGVDDWAWRKGQRYGTLITDLEAGQPIEILPSWESEAVAAWLRAHPSVTIVARDRATAYANAIHMGAPTAIQVADRWHLLFNLRTVVERGLARLYKQLKQLPRPPPSRRTRPWPSQWG